MFEIGSKLKKLRKQSHITIDELSKETGVGKSTISDIETGKAKSPKTTTLKKLADYFNVSMDYILGNTNETEKPELNKRDLRNIAKDVDSIMNKLDKGEDGPTYYNDIEMQDEDKELFRSALEYALKTIKVKNKEKYTPKKYRK